MHHESSKSKHSIGALRKAKKKTKPRSSDLIGKLHLQRDAFEAMAKMFQATDQDEIICGIVGCGYREKGELCISVELSPPYQPTKTRETDILATIFGGEDRQ